MTRQRRYGQDTPFGGWLRGHPALPSRHSAKAFDAENLDYIWFEYRTGDLMLLEEKRKAGTLLSRSTWAQQDTHRVVDQMLTAGSVTNILTVRGVRQIRYRGYHVIRLEHDSPEHGWIEIDSRRVTKEDLLLFLRFEAPDDWYERRPWDQQLAQPSMASAFAGASVDAGRIR